MKTYEVRQTTRCAVVFFCFLFGLPVFVQTLTAQTSIGQSSTAKTIAAQAPEEALPLAEVKVAGSLHSSYKNHQPRDIGAIAPKPDLAAYRTQIEPILRTACFECHGAETQEADFRVDQLDPDLQIGGDVDWWLEVVDVLSNDEMPPEDEGELSDEDRSNVIQWLSSELQIASQVRRSEQGHSSFRRMSRYEYNYALQDLLGLPYDFSKDLPPETPSEDGFTNSSEVLQMSAMQFEYYRKLGRDALRKVTVRGKRPKTIHYAVSMEAAVERVKEGAAQEIEKIRERLQGNPEKLQRELEKRAARNSARGTHYLDHESGETFKNSWRYNGARYAWTPTSTREAIKPSSFVAVIPSQQKWIFELGNTLPDAGMLRVRFLASRRSVEEPAPPSLRLVFGWQASNNSSASEVLSDREIVVEALPGDPQTYQWDLPMSEINVRNPMRKTAKMGDTPSPSEYLQIVNTTVSKSDVQIHHVEVSTPVYEQWPPESHTQIFIDREVDETEANYAQRILANFMSRAWRRPIVAAELSQKMELFTEFRDECDDFEETMIEVLATVLASPQFLYLGRSDVDKDESGYEGLNDFQLATRLSMFLWCSIPDQELHDLAMAGTLRNPKVLAAQTTRMLADPKSERFSEQFVRGWLGMQLLDFLNVDKKVYPQFNSSLKEAMQREPVALFQDVLQHNHSVIDFIHADYAIVNERLAKHYGIKVVYGNHFQRVSLEGEARRGGLLTQAGLLAMNSDGKDSHPLKRGIWMLERLLNDPPPPPPPAVPEIDLADPAIAKMTLKQRIENHRDDPACLSCHAKIDPWGISLENFDAVGSWRTKINDQDVDASSLLFNKQELNGVDGLKRFLLSSRQDQFARAMAYKLTTYALGRPLTFRDRSSIDQITADLRRHDDGLSTLVSLITTSELFRSK